MSLQLDERQRAMLREMGVTDWSPRAPVASVTAVEKPPPRLATRAVAATAPAGDLSVPSPKPVDADAGGSHPVARLDWPALRSAVVECQACALCVGRKAAVMLAEPQARQTDWLVVGEPPDEEEERYGMPFSGQSGQLLDNMLRAVQVTRDGIGAAGARLTNVVKCRSGTARNPAPSELAACLPYLQREIALSQPRVILAMGRFAAQSLLAQSHPELLAVPLGQLRGRVFQLLGIPLVVTFHPARLLRARQDKALAWADLCLALSAARPSYPTHPISPISPISPSP